MQEGSKKFCGIIRTLAEYIAENKKKRYYETLLLKSCRLY